MQDTEDKSKVWLLELVYKTDSSDVIGIFTSETKAKKAMQQYIQQTNKSAKPWVKENEHWYTRGWWSIEIRWYPVE